MRVGGIKEKVLAAVRFGLKEIILPEENHSDWMEVPKEARELGSAVKVETPQLPFR